jgi:hypothetical protein
MDVKERREQIKKVIDEIGIFAINKSELGRRFEVSDVQISRDIEEIMSDMPPVNWVAILNRSQHELEYTIKVVSKAMEDATDPKTRSNLATQLSEMVLRKASLMEKMDRLLPANMKPEPVTITYKCIEATTPVKAKEEQAIEPDVSLDGVLDG